MNYYEILGVKQDVDEKELNKVFKKLSKKYHPDRQQNKSDQEKKDAEKKFQEISEAYNTLSDKQKRQEYDMQLNGFGNFNGFGDYDPFGDFNPFRRQQRTPVGTNIQTTVKVSLKDFYDCKTITVHYQKDVECKHCHGTGSEDGKVHTCQHCHGTGRFRTQKTNGMMMFVQETTCPYCGGTGQSIANPCKHCNGSGFEKEDATTEITLRPDICTYDSVNLKGLGNSVKGGVNGDLYVILQKEEDKNFKLEGLNLVMKLPLNLYEALCGCEKTITAIDGKKIKVTIPEGTSNETIFRIAGKGMTPAHSLFLTVEYVIPNKLNGKQKRLLKEFYEAGNK